ncbi:MAG TPA: undecaprenyl-diphosphate phosphatase [Ignavibacteria bacterium]|nr:undecaprenyl-diphosphatase [Bacteroidota bacterium]HRI86159.1 undecaprenyl-diphosphate phosphatase [Ignavibacteria bacterium]HRJ98559.1 undecaprenyl-diphosphate phosphatase [Ignavibacteria bacterium]
MIEEIFKAIILGIIQGATEFIPISSTAHLRVIPALLGWKDIGAAYSAVIQLGTLAATLVYFRNDISQITGGFLKAVKQRDLFSNMDSKIFIFIIAGTIPISVAGLLLKGFIEGDARGLYVISFALIILAVILFIAERTGKQNKSMENMTLKDGIIIGCAQALALIPGSSRSGVTITAGLFTGLTREASARYSFLLSIPAIGLSGLYELFKERHELLNENLLSLIIATAVSLISGYLAIAFLINYLKKRSTMIFIVYRIALGILILILLSQGILQNLD